MPSWAIVSLLQRKTQKEGSLYNDAENSKPFIASHEEVFANRLRDKLPDLERKAKEFEGIFKPANEFFRSAQVKL